MTFRAGASPIDVRPSVDGQAPGEDALVREVKGLRAAITHVLAARSLALSELGRARLTSCADVAVLAAWLERAATAASEAEVFVGADGVWPCGAALRWGPH
jgi:hypothetical protein